MPSFKFIGLWILEKEDFLRFLLYMGVALTGQAVSEKKSLKMVAGHRTDTGSMGIL